MLAEEKTKRQNELKKYIYELSESLLANDNEKREMALKLVQLYRDRFRHSYSEFFPIILDISRTDNNYSIDYLSENLETLRAFVEADYIAGRKEYSIIYSRLEKLCDHLNLEIGRWSYYSQNEHRIEDISLRTNSLNEEMRNAKEALNAANNELSNAKDQLEDASEQASSMQTEVIAVLSIFAGIAFVFSGGMSFLGSAITSINEAKHYEAVVLVAIICGMVVFNTIFLLMYLVGKITNRNIYANCKTKDCSCEERCSGIKKIRNRLPYVYYFNIVCVVGVIIDCIVWYCDIRNWLYL